MTNKKYQKIPICQVCWFQVSVSKSNPQEVDWGSPDWATRALEGERLILPDPQLPPLEVGICLEWEFGDFKWRFLPRKSSLQTKLAVFSVLLTTGSQDSVLVLSPCWVKRSDCSTQSRCLVMSRSLTIFTYILLIGVLSLSIISFHSSGPFCPKYACRDLSGSNLLGCTKTWRFQLDFLDPSCFWQNCLLTKDETHGGSRFVMCSQICLLWPWNLLFPMRFGRVMFLRNLNAQLLRNKPISESCRSSKNDRNRWIRWTGRVKKLPSCGSNCDVPL